MVLKDEKPSSRSATNTAKCIGVIILLEILVQSRIFYAYANTVNVYQLTESSASFLNLAGFLRTVCSIPVNLFQEKIMQAKPWAVVATYGILQGTLSLLYGIAMSLDGAIEVKYQLILSLMASIPLAIVQYLLYYYVNRHLIIEISTLRGVDIGFLNSVNIIAGCTLAAIFDILAGQILSWLSFPYFNLLLGFLTLTISCGIGGVTCFCLTDISGIPENRNSASNEISLKKQINKFKNSPILKVIIAEVVVAHEMHEQYLGLILLKCGLSAQALSYVKAASQVMLLSGCALNMVKRRLGFNGQYIETVIIFKVITFILGVYLFSAYTITMFLPWYRDSSAFEVKEKRPLAMWTLVYIILLVPANCCSEFEKLIKLEYIQKFIPNADRGALSGLEKACIESTLTVRNGIWLLVPDEWLYIQGLALNFIASGASIGFYVSHKMSSNNWIEPGIPENTELKGLLSDSKREHEQS